MAPTVRKRPAVQRPARPVLLSTPDPARIEGRDLFPTSPGLSLSPESVTDVLYRFVSGEEGLHSEARRAAATNTPVLIMGEPGTGKSALARFIHEESRRHGGRFVEFNCDGIPESLLSAQLFGTSGARPGEPGSFERALVRDAQGGTLLISGFEKGAAALRPQLLPWLDARGERPARTGGPAQVDARLIVAADQDIRSHVDRTLWQRLLSWPPILLTPLRVQRRKKWNLFCAVLDQAAAVWGLEPPVTTDFLLYVFVASYGWPGNARQLADFACYLVQVGALENRHLSLDSEFCFFDAAEAFAQDDVLDATREATGQVRLYRNRVHRDFARALGAMQANGSGRVWQEISKASPGRLGQWSYPRLRWNDPYFAGAELCSRVGQAYDAALGGLGSWHDRLPARELLYLPSELPWVTDLESARVEPGLSRTDLARQVAYGLVTGEIPDKETLLTQVYEAIVGLAPDLTPKDYQELGIPKARLRSLLSKRKRT